MEIRSVRVERKAVYLVNFDLFCMPKVNFLWAEIQPHQTEPPRVSRRPISLSQAACGRTVGGNAAANGLVGGGIGATSTVANNLINGESWNKDILKGR